jgi:uncharacterized protein (DUF1800 family)
MDQAGMMQSCRVAILSVLLSLTACGGGGSGDGGAPPPPAPPPAPPPTPSAAALESAARLLDRTTFGADYALIESVAQEGNQVWLDRQFTLPASNHLPVVTRYGDLYGYEVNANPPPGTYRRFAWWERTLTAPDQLRQRVAYALTQVFVVSDNVDDLFINPLGLASYYDTLLAHAFGNFRDLLYAVTLHPVMGIYLSHVNNGKSDPVANTFPDENYAREVMQLFSIGLFELNADGSQKLNASANPIPTYDNDDIQEFAKIFTGLSYGPAQQGGASFFGKQAPVLHVPMVMFDAFHEPGEKRLLNGVVVPAGQTGIEDISDAIDNLFNHPNVGPFIGRLLIQRLVTSNPSPAYVGRVAAAFAGGGGMPRGDMRAVLRAVLLDPEAVSGIKLREPFLRYVQLNRAVPATSDDGTYPGLGYVAQFLLQQHVLSAPSVFNFYSPNYSPAGELGNSGLFAPEFQITTDSTVVGLANLMAYAIYTDQSIDTPQGFPAIRLDLSALEALADDPVALVDRLDLLLAAGAMNDATKQAIRDAITPVANDLPGRVRLALYLAAISPATAVQG